MSNNAGIYVTIDEGYGRDPFINVPSRPIRENWMNGPTRANFTGCGSAGWNAGKAPCASCGGGQKGSRICNACRNNANMSQNCGGNACAWQPPVVAPRESATKPNVFYF